MTYGIGLHRPSAFRRSIDRQAEKRRARVSFAWINLSSRTLLVSRCARVSLSEQHQLGHVKTTHSKCPPFFQLCLCSNFVCVQYGLSALVAAMRTIPSPSATMIQQSPSPASRALLSLLFTVCACVHSADQTSFVDHAAQCSSLPVACTHRSRARPSACSKHAAASRLASCLPLAKRVCRWLKPRSHSNSSLNTAFFLRPTLAAGS